MTSPVPAAPKIYHIVHVDRAPSIIAAGGLLCDAEVRKLPMVKGTAVGLPAIKEKRRRAEIKSHPGLFVGSCVPFHFCPRSVMLSALHYGGTPGLEYHGGQKPIIHLEADLHATIAWADQEEKRWAFTTSNAGGSSFMDYGDLKFLSEIDWSAVRSTQWSDGGSDVAATEVLDARPRTIDDEWGAQVEGGRRPKVGEKIRITTAGGKSWMTEVREVVEETPGYTLVRTGLGAKSGKQAEFLVEKFFPWCLVERIGTRSESISRRVLDSLTDIEHRPAVEVQSCWYY